MNNLNHIENSSQFQIDILDIGYGSDMEYGVSLDLE